MSTLNRFVLLTCLLSCLLAPGTGHARSPDISRWMKVVSSTPTLEPSPTVWQDDMVNMSVTGNTVHMLWWGRRSDWGDARFVYRRSLDRGVTWQPAKVLASNSDFAGSTVGSNYTLQDTTHMCVVGNTVHVVLNRSLPGGGGRNWHYSLEYYRSGDGGKTFSSRRVLVDGADVHHVVQPRIACSPQRVVIGYNYYANWYSNFAITILVSGDGGSTFGPGRVLASSSDRSGSLEDLAVRGTRIHALYYRLLEPYYYGNFQARIGHLSTVTDGVGKRTVWLTTKALDGRYYALGTKDRYNSPDLVVTADSAHVLWSQLSNNYQGTDSLMYARIPHDIKLPVVRRMLEKNAALYPGQETLAVGGSNVYVLYPMTNNTVNLRVSRNGGDTFLAAKALSTTGGWWPKGLVGPADESGATFHALWDAPGFRVTRDAGATFSRVMWVHPAFTTDKFARSQHAIDSQGALHIASLATLYSNSVCGGYCDNDAVFRRIGAPAVPTSAAKALRLMSDSADPTRYDNMQAQAKTINFAKSLTAEAWVQDMGGGVGTGSSLYVKPFLFKQRDVTTSYAPAYALGSMDDYGSRKLLGELRTTSQHYSLATSGETGRLVAGEWTHVALTYDSTKTSDNLKLYKNGVLIAKTTATGLIQSGTGNLFVGRYGNWLVDEVRLWNVARTQNQIQIAMQNKLAGTEVGLQAYYPFSDSLKDMTNKGNDGLPMYKETFTGGKN